MKNYLEKWFPHAVVIALFVGISAVFFYPVLQGKKLKQSDIVQYTGMAKARNDLRAERESYWTDSAFGGMPTYQLGAEYPHNYIKSVDKVIRFLPRPADYLFLYLVGFYALLLVLRVRYLYAFLGAIGFGFSTYLMVILAVGHNAKAHAIGYFAFALVGILLALRRKYALGFLVTTLALALQISANHFQMTYYFLLLVAVLMGVELISAVRQKQVLQFTKSASVIAFAGIFSLLLNATSLLATQEYALFSTRGTSTLTINPDGSPKTAQRGLSKDYITEYSYGIGESLNLLVPRLFGGANNENVGEASETYQYLTQRGVSAVQALEFSQNLPTYWGNQPIVAAPAYIGIVIFFLFVLGVIIVKGRLKWWLLAGTIFSLWLSWGKNSAMLTDFMIDYFPLYNKFRAVSSVQVVLELCVPILAVLGLSAFVRKVVDRGEIPVKDIQKPLYYAFGITSGILVLLLLMKNAFSFEGLNDSYYAQAYGSELMQVIKEDRKAMYSADVWKAIGFVVVAFGALWGFSKGKLAEKGLVIALLALISLDMLPVARRYFPTEQFVTAREVEQPFQLSPAEEAILKDTTHYRVFSVREGLNGARTSYFFKSIGGYHAAKPRAIQDLFDYQIYKNNMQVLNMLNVKYLIFPDEEGQLQVQRNPATLGNAWFVPNIVVSYSADEMMKALDTLSPSKTALLRFEHPKMARPIQPKYTLDSLASIRLEKYAPDELVYVSDNAHKGFAVFSEIYYPQGWEATIDGEKVSIRCVNYTLRGLEIPEGKHRIVFKFVPAVVKIGSTITLYSSVLFAVLLVTYFVFLWKKKRNEV